jgi:hypothetical protein
MALTVWPKIHPEDSSQINAAQQPARGVRGTGNIRIPRYVGGWMQFRPALCFPTDAVKNATALGEQRGSGVGGARGLSRTIYDNTVRRGRRTPSKLFRMAALTRTNTIGV